MGEVSTGYSAEDEFAAGHPRHVPRSLAKKLKGIPSIKRMTQQYCGLLVSEFRISVQNTTFLA